MISNEKPSAIFRLRGTAVPVSTDPVNVMQSGPPLQVIPGHVTATLGILCQTVDEVQQEMATLRQSITTTGLSSMSDSTSSLPARPPTAQDTVALAQKIAKNLFNYLSSFVPPSNNTTLGRASQGQWIEVGTVEKWYKNFEAKLKNGGVTFLDRGE